MQLQCPADSRHAEEQLPACEVCSRPLRGLLGAADCWLPGSGGSECILRPCSQQCSSMRVLVGSLKAAASALHLEHCQVTTLSNAGWQNSPHLGLTFLCAYGQLDNACKVCMLVF